MHVKKKGVFVIFILLFLIIGIFVINAVVDKTKQWHSASTNIKILVDGAEKTLQQAINENLFNGTHAYSSPLSTSSGGHNADSIWVSVGGTESNLIQALSSTGLCGSTTLSYTGPTDKTKSYHYATEIEITVNGSTMSLQDAIDNGKWCYGWIMVPGDGSLGTSDFLVMKYEAKNVNGKPTSQPGGTPWININFNYAKTLCEGLGSGYHLLTNAEWMTIARNVESTPESWTGGAVGSGMIKRGNVGTNDDGSYDGANPEYGTGRNTKAELQLSNDASIWDFSGNVDEWVDGTCTPGTGNGFWHTQTGEWSNVSLSDFERAEAGPSTSINYGSTPTTKGAGIYYGCRYDDSINSTPAYAAVYHAFTRGGNYVSRTYAGIFYTSFQIRRDQGANYIGFRCVKSFDEYSYLWNFGFWSNCEAGGGISTRTVYCKRNDQTQVADSYCTGTKPPTSQECWSGDVWSASCPWGLPCWQGAGCSSCPWGTVSSSDPYNIYCKTNGKQGTWGTIFGGNGDWREYRFGDYAAKCCCSRSTSSGPYYNTRWRIIN